MALPKSDYASGVGDNIAADWLNEVSLLAAKMQSVALASTTPVTLTATQYRARVITFSGTLTTNIAVVVPTEAGRAWICRNATAGAFSVTVKTSAGAGVAITQGRAILLYCDGVDVKPGAAESTA